MTKSYANQNSFSKALKAARIAHGLSQESFGLVSSRTYVSSLERRLKIPTVNKIDELAGVIGVHPLTLLTLAYLSHGGVAAVEELMDQVKHEVLEIASLTATA